MPLRYGGPPPAFTLPATGGGDISLGAFRSRCDVVLAFYCFDWGSI